MLDFHRNQEHCETLYQPREGFLWEFNWNLKVLMPENCIWLRSIHRILKLNFNFYIPPEIEYI